MHAVDAVHPCTYKAHTSTYNTYMLTTLYTQIRGTHAEARWSTDASNTRDIYTLTADRVLELFIFLYPNKIRIV